MYYGNRLHSCYWVLYADEHLTGALFETSKSSQKSEETVLGAITMQCVCNRLSVLPQSHSCVQMNTCLECCSRRQSLPRNPRKLFWVQSRSRLRLISPYWSVRSVCYDMLYNMQYDMLHMLFAENLFHFKLDQPEYSIHPGEFDRPPLFHDNKRHKTLLNEFFYVVERSWRVPQGFVLAEHEGYPSDFLGRTHGAHSEEIAKRE